jgi:hypothetical protein
MKRKQRGRQEKQKDKEDAQKYNHIHTATFDHLMSSNTDEGMLLSYKILVGPQSHSKGNKSLFHH